MGNTTSDFLWGREGRKSHFRVNVAIINFLCVHFTHAVNLSLKGIIYSSLHRFLNSEGKDFAYCKVCNTDDKAEKSELLQPSHHFEPFLPARL